MKKKQEFKLFLEYDMTEDFMKQTYKLGILSEYVIFFSAVTKM